MAVLCRIFGLEHVEIAEDIVSDTFLSATELWGLKGLPENPVAWLYTVSKNKTKDFLKRNSLFAQKISPQLKYGAAVSEDLVIDLSEKNINDSRLAMMFAVCNPVISPEAQVALALNLLCGFGAEEIADAFLTNKDLIYKRLSRAKEKLRAEKINIAEPPVKQIGERTETVLTVIYLLFNEGYCSASQNIPLRRDLCMEAMELAVLLTENVHTNIPPVNALLALMCFHASRFDARIGIEGEIILYEDQDRELWNAELIGKGEYYLSTAAFGPVLSKYHLEAGIAFWHTRKKDNEEKWENILQLYNRLLQLEYSPIAALNRTYALAKVKGNTAGITEAQKLNLEGNYLYHALLGNLYREIDHVEALKYLQQAFALARSEADRAIISRNIEGLTEKHINHK